MRRAAGAGALLSQAAQAGLKAAGYGVAELRAGGYRLAELRTDGYTARDPDGFASAGGVRGEVAWIGLRRYMYLG